MGSPLGPTFANCLHVYFHEQKCLTNCPDLLKPVLYHRYVDDTFLLFRSPEHIMPFLKYLNSQHNNIQFTHDSEQNNALPFLDVFVKKEGNHFTTKCLSQTYFYWFVHPFLQFPTITRENSYFSNLLSHAVPPVLALFRHTF